MTDRAVWSLAALCVLAALGAVVRQPQPSRVAPVVHEASVIAPHWVENLDDRTITIRRSTPADVLVCLPRSSGPDVCDLIQNWTRGR